MAGKKYTVEHGTGKYQFGICGAATAPCLENAGVCLITNGQSTSMGVANETLTMSDTQLPYLEYKSGAVCEQLHQQWTTKIEFVCERTGFSGGPKIIEDTKCQLIIQFPTNLVCKKEVSKIY